MERSESQDEPTLVTQKRTIRHKHTRSQGEITNLNNIRFSIIRKQTLPYLNLFQQQDIHSRGFCKNSHGSGSSLYGLGASQLGRGDEEERKWQERHRLERVRNQRNLEKMRVKRSYENLRVNSIIQAAAQELQERQNSMLNALS